MPRSLNPRSRQLLDDIEKTAYALAEVAKDYETIMYKGRGHFLKELNARRYSELVERQKDLLRQLREDTP